MEELSLDLVILGGGPGAYNAAFRAADLGRKVTIIEERENLGGICLNVGCIPSKTLLHAAEMIYSRKEAQEYGITSSDYKLDLDQLRKKKVEIIGNLIKGLNFLAKKRKVDVIRGYGTFADDSTIHVTGGDGEKKVSFKHCIIAAGSRPVIFSSLPADDERLWDSTDALELTHVPKKLMVLGGGIVGLEMATIYNALGSDVTVVEMLDQILPMTDKDVARVVEKRLKKQGVTIKTKTKLESIQPKDDGLLATYDGEDVLYDIILVSVGRRPNGDMIGLENTSIEHDDKGFIGVDETMKTSVDSVFAVGDIVGQPMLAHKASQEGIVAAEVACGRKSAFVARTVPSVVYTIPEAAWTGLSEKDAEKEGIRFTRGKFPYSANGRAMVHNATDGFVKILFEEESHRVIGAAMVGPHAGDMISELTLALEMGADMEDIGKTIHPHPTLAETIGFAAEVAAGTAVEI